MKSLTDADRYLAEFANRILRINAQSRVQYSGGNGKKRWVPQWVPTGRCLRAMLLALISSARSCASTDRRSAEIANRILRINAQSRVRCSGGNGKKDGYPLGRHPEGSLCELNLPRSSRASAERSFVKFANRILRTSAEPCPMKWWQRQKKIGTLMGAYLFLEAPPGIGPGIEVLQTFALPLGHGAIFS